MMLESEWSVNSKENVKCCGSLVAGRLSVMVIGHPKGSEPLIVPKTFSTPSSSIGVALAAKFEN
jgi:hypothetical protein